jgi:hypothetical protein
VSWARSRLDLRPVANRPAEGHCPLRDHRELVIGLVVLGAVIGGVKGIERQDMKARSEVVRLLLGAVTLGMLAVIVVSPASAAPASSSADTAGLHLFNPAATSPTQTQRLTAYLVAVAAARQPVLAFRAQVQAAISDINNNNFNLQGCPDSVAPTLLRNAMLLGTASSPIAKASTKAKLGDRNYGTLHAGIDSYSQGAFEAQVFYSRLAGVCEDISSESGHYQGLSDMRTLMQTSRQTCAHINSQLSVWRQSVVVRAGQLHMSVPRWVYTVGTN